MLDDGSDLLVWPSALLLNVVTLSVGNWREVYGYSPGSLLKSCFAYLCSEYIFGVTGLGVGIITVLQASVCSPSSDLHICIFLGVLGIIAFPKVVDCLFLSHLLDAVVDVVTESVSIFSFKERHEHVIDFVLLLLAVTKLVFG